MIGARHNRLMAALAAGIALGLLAASFARPANAVLALNFESPLSTPASASPSGPTSGQAITVAQTPIPTFVTTPVTTQIPSSTPSVEESTTSAQVPIIIIAGGTALTLLALIIGWFVWRRRQTGNDSPGGPASPEAPPPIESQILCPKCGAYNKPAAKFCKACGAALQSYIPAADAMPAGGAQTRPLGIAAEATGSMLALAVGATLADNHYRVAQVIQQSQQLNWYLVEALEPVLRCPLCGTDNPADGAQFCQHCRAVLTNVPPAKLNYRVKEAAELDRFRTEYAMAQQGEAHLNLVPPRQAFTQQVNEETRYYVVLDELTWKTAQQITSLPELPLALAWGIGLADGLAYLHERHVVMRNLSGNEVALLPHVAQWADFETAQLVSPQEWQRSGPSLMMADVRQLAAVLYRLFTGRDQFEPGSRSLTPTVNALFEQALSSSSTGYLTATELALALREAEADVRRPAGLDVCVARLSDVGRERDLDEDSILTLELGQVFRSRSTPLGVYAVADGMGGHESGDVASRLAIRALARRALNDLFLPALDDLIAPPDYEAWIKTAVQEANQAVLAQRKATRNDMGTTLVMTVVVNDTAYVGHVGDSRAYLIRNGEIRPLTVDHSLVERLVATKQITREEAATHPQRNVIYKNIGDRAHVDPDVSRHTLLAGDRLLLCCDGLSGEVGDADLLRLVQENPALPEACQQLIRAANEAGGHDNISVVIVQVLATSVALE